jgi:hypothetical protein
MVFSESPHSSIVYGLSCQTEQHKLIYAVRKPIDDLDVFRQNISLEKSVLFYEIQKDPWEKYNLGPGTSGSDADLRNELIAHKRRNDDHRKTVRLETEPVDEATIQQLRSLGYIH